MQARPSSTYNFHSRQPSYYAYPVSPASYNDDASPPMPPSTSSNESNEAPPFTAQPIASGSASGSGEQTPAKKPSLTPLVTTLRRQNSSSSGSGEMGQLDLNLPSIVHVNHPHLVRHVHQAHYPPHPNKVRIHLEQIHPILQVGLSHESMQNPSHLRDTSPRIYGEFIILPILCARSARRCTASRSTCQFANATVTGRSTKS